MQLPEQRGGKIQEDTEADTKCCHLYERLEGSVGFSEALDCKHDIDCLTRLSNSRSY